MNITSYNPYGFNQEVEAETYTFRDKVSALVNQNIIGAKFLSDPYMGSDIDKDYNFASPEVVEELRKNNVQPDEYDKYADTVSMYDLKKRISQRNSNTRDMKVIESMGAGGIAASFIVGAADPLGWAIGGGAGKVAQLGSNIFNLGSKGIRLTQGVGAAAGGIGSYTALEYSLNGDVSDEALAITGILGGAIGYATAGGLLNKSVPNAMENMAQYGVEASPYKKLDNMLNWMHSSADNLKTSDNPAARELGYKISRSMRDVGLQAGDTANDYLADSTQILNKFKEDFDNFRNDYKKQYGEKFTLEQEKEFNRIAQEIDNEYTLLKDKAFNEEVATYKSEQLTAINEEYNTKVNELSKDNRYRFIGIHTGDYNKLGDIPTGKDVDIYGDSVFGNNATYIDPDGRWYKGEHGYDLSKKRYVSQVETTLDNPLIINDDTIESVSKELDSLNIKAGNGEELNKALQAKGYDGVVVDFKKDNSYIPTVDDIKSLNIEDNLKKQLIDNPQDIFILRDNPEIKKFLESFQGKLDKYNIGQNQIVVFNPKKSLKSLGFKDTAVDGPLSDADIKDMIKGKVDIPSPDKSIPLNKKINNLKAKKDRALKLQQQREDTAKQSKGIKTRISDIKKEVSAIKKNISPINKEIKTLEREYKKLSKEAKSKSIGDKKASITRKIKGLKTKIESYNTDIEAKNKQITSQQEKLSKFESIDTKGKKQEAMSLQKTIKETEAELKKLEAENTAKKKEIDKLRKEYDTKVKKLEKAKVDNEFRLEANKRVQTKVGNKIDELIASKNPRLQPLLKSFQNMTRQYGESIKETDLNGLKDTVDTNWYAPRAYDVNKIIENQEAATNAFRAAILSNFDEVTEEIVEEATRAANKIVGSITNIKADYEAFDMDIGVLREKKNWSKLSSGRLKGRKLKLDASKLVDFMQDDIMHTMSSYSRRVGGEVALKKSLGVDKNNPLETLMDNLNIHGKDKEWLYDAVNRIKGTAEIDPNANSGISKAVRAFNLLNYINFGGWFGVNTLTDIANVVNDFDFGRSMKYVTRDISDALKMGDSRESKKLARILGLASESLTNDRAILMGAESFGQGRAFLGEKQLSGLAATMGKLSGLNMTIDMMDRVVSMSGLDYILTKDMSSKNFQKTMNRLGLSSDDIIAIRNSNIADIKLDGLHNVNLDRLAPELKTKVERALKRATRDTVLRANEIDTPKMLSEVMGSKTLAKALFQFMRFPIVAYNKLGIKMKENFDVANATIATMTAASILTLTNQAKDIGKEEPRFDLDTKEGMTNNIISVVERLPHMSVVSIPQSYVDILGRLGSAATGEDYKGRPSVNMGITVDRLQDVATAGGNMLSMKPTKNDLLVGASFVPFTNLPYLQPFNNMFRDEIKGVKSKTGKPSRITKEDVEEYIDSNNKTNKQKINFKETNYSLKENDVEQYKTEQSIENNNPITNNIETEAITPETLNNQSDDNTDTIETRNLTDNFGQVNEYGNKMSQEEEIQMDNYVDEKMLTKEDDDANSEYKDGIKSIETKGKKEIVKNLNDKEEIVRNLLSEKLSNDEYNMLKSIIAFSIGKQETNNKNIEQYNNGPGRGIYQYELGKEYGGSRASKTALNRYNSIYGTDLKEEDFTKYDADTQTDILMADLAKTKGTTSSVNKIIKSKNVDEVKSNLAELWAKYHKKTNVSKEEIKRFISNLDGYEEELKLLIE